MSETNIESVLQEKRLFTPPPEFSQQAQIKTIQQYEQLYNSAAADPEQFWGKIGLRRTALVSTLG